MRGRQALKKVLVMGMSFARGGMETCIMNYVRNVDHDEFTFDFITYNKPPYCLDEIENSGGHVYVIPGRSANLKEHKKQLREIFEKHGAEYDAFWYNLCLISDIELFKLAKKAGIRRRIIHAHQSQGMGNIITNTLHKIYKKKVEKMTTDHWACSMSAAEFFYSEKTIKGPSFKKVTNAIDLSAFAYNETGRNEIRKELGAGEDFVFCNIARLNPEKNQTFLLDVFEKIYEKNKNTALWVVGQGVLEESLKNKANTLNSREKIHFLGRRDDVPKVYSAADCFILPSVFEGLPMTLVEAQASGLVCFTSNEAVPQEAAITENLHFLSLEDSADKWAEEILNIKNTDRAQVYKTLEESRWNIKNAAKEFMKNE